MLVAVKRVGCEIFAALVVEEEFDGLGDCRFIPALSGWPTIQEVAAGLPTLAGAVIEGSGIEKECTRKPTASVKALQSRFRREPS
jgi:hypothetical protein